MPISLCRFWQNRSALKWSTSPTRSPTPPSRSRIPVSKIYGCSAFIFSCTLHIKAKHLAANQKLKARKGSATVMVHHNLGAAGKYCVKGFNVDEKVAKCLHFHYSFVFCKISNTSKISSKCKCDSKVFPLNGLKRTRRDFHKSLVLWGICFYLESLFCFFRW